MRSLMIAARGAASHDGALIIIHVGIARQPSAHRLLQSSWRLRLSRERLTPKQLEQLNIGCDPAAPSSLPYGCPRSAAISVRFVPQPLFDNVNPRWSRLVVCRCLISLPLNSGPFSREHVFGSSSGEIRQETSRRGEALLAGCLKRKRVPGALR